MHVRIDYVDMESEFKMVKMILEEKRHEKVEKKRYLSLSSLLHEMK